LVSLKAKRQILHQNQDEIMNDCKTLFVVTSLYTSEVFDG